jgi:hypothetical protein
MLELMKKLNFRARDKVQVLRNRQNHQIDVNYESLGVSRDIILPGAYEKIRAAKTMP